MWFAKIKVSHSMCGLHEDTDIIHGPVILSLFGPLHLALVPNL